MLSYIMFAIDYIFYFINQIMATQAFIDVRKPIDFYIVVCYELYL